MIDIDLGVGRRNGQPTFVKIARLAKAIQELLEV
jgi:hypothetical protein